MYELYADGNIRSQTRCAHTLHMQIYSLNYINEWTNGTQITKHPPTHTHFPPLSGKVDQEVPHQVFYYLKSHGLCNEGA